MYVEPKDQSAWVYFDWLIPHLCLLCTLSLTISVKTYHMHITCGPTVNCLDEDAKRPLLEDEIHQCDELLGVEPDCVCLSISSPFLPHFLSLPMHHHHLLHPLFAVALLTKMRLCVLLNNGTQTDESRELLERLLVLDPARTGYYRYILSVQ